MDPWGLSAQRPHSVQNFVAGKWVPGQKHKTIVDPLNGEEFIKIPDEEAPEVLAPFVESMKQCPKSGLHNPLKNPERYNLYGAVCFRIAEEMRKPQVLDYFCRLLQRVIPKSDTQVLGEVVVTRRFFENFAGDIPRYICRSFG